MKHTAEESDEAKATDYLAKTLIEPDEIGPIGYVYHAGNFDRDEWLSAGASKPRIRVQAPSRPHQKQE